MGSLAKWLSEEGDNIVTGSDGPIYPPMSHILGDSKVQLTDQYSPTNLNGAKWGIEAANPDIVVIGNAISRGHVEAEIAEKLQAEGRLNIMSFAEALSKYCIEGRESFVICGTHGKSTCTSMTAWGLEALGKKPGFFVGAAPLNFQFGMKKGESHFVSEGDEYDTAYWDKESKFLHYRPDWVLCTGLEFDHADIFKNEEDVLKCFEKLAQKTKKGWVLIDDASSPAPHLTKRLANFIEELGLKLHRYGHSESSDYRIEKMHMKAIELNPDERAQEEVMEIALKSRGSSLKESSSYVGNHNALNLCGVHGLLKTSGAAGLGENCLLDGYSGIKRRQEILFNDSRLVVIDDFAHHPTAIRETISAVKSRFPNSSVAAFFEPRSATSARSILQESMNHAFLEADGVFLSPPTKDNVPMEERLNVEEISQKLSPKICIVEKDVELLAEQFFKWRKTQGQTVVALVMSNGAFGGIHDILISKVSHEIALQQRPSCH